MTWLFIDTHLAGTYRYGWLETGKPPIMRSHAGRTSGFLAQLAKDWVKHKKTLAGICVVAGPGSFSAVRTGVLHANLLARLLGVPLIDVRAEEADPVDTLVERIQKGLLTPKTYVAPIYDAEPNITIPKRT